MHKKLRDPVFPVFVRSVPCLMSVLQAPVVISRDHHDVSGTDSPFRETSNIYDGSAFTAGITFFSFSAAEPPKCIIQLSFITTAYFDRYGRAKLHWRRIQRCNLGCFAQRWRMRLVSGVEWMLLLLHNFIAFFKTKTLRKSSCQKWAVLLVAF